MSVVVERDMITYCFLRLFSLLEWSGVVDEEVMDMYRHIEEYNQKIAELKQLLDE